MDMDADDVSAGGFVEAAVTEVGPRVPSGATLEETGICGTRDALGDRLSTPIPRIVRAVTEDAS